MQLASGRSMNKPPLPHLFCLTTRRETWLRGNGERDVGNVGEKRGSEEVLNSRRKEGLNSGRKNVFKEREMEVNNECLPK